MVHIYAIIRALEEHRQDRERNNKSIDVAHIEYTFSKMEITYRNNEKVEIDI